MLDRFLNGALWLTVMSMITGTAAGSLGLSYRGLFELCATRYAWGGIALGAGMLLGLASYLLARNANDLIDR
jgi:hypothetical protein